MMKIIIISWLLLTQVYAIRGERRIRIEPPFEKELPSPNYLVSRDNCLTGYMTDVQTWVDEVGTLTPNVDKTSAIDLTGELDAVRRLMNEIQTTRKSRNFKTIRYLGLARCNLRRVPTVFQATDSRGRSLYTTIEYITLFGNNFTDISIPGQQYVEIMNATNAQPFDAGFRRPAQSSWAVGFNQVTFTNLKELDLRRCSIQQLSDNLFSSMPNLEALYLSENRIAFLSADTFRGLKNLLHLDLSRNTEFEPVALESAKVFNPLEKLVSLDLSMTQFHQQDVILLCNLGSNLQRLSLCYTGFTYIPNRSFNNTSLRYLDVSGNNGVLSGTNPLGGIEDTLEVLYAKHAGIKSVKVLRLEKLEVLNLEGNEVTDIPLHVIKTWKKLRVLNLDNNRVSTWFTNLFKPLKTLSILSLRDNNIMVVSKEMLEDFQNISYIGLTGATTVCNCRSRELIEIAYRNQNMTNTTPITKRPRGRFNFHKAFDDFNSLIDKRKNIRRGCKNCSDVELEFDGNFQIFDYDNDAYSCLQATEAKKISFFEVNTCGQVKREGGLKKSIQSSIQLLYVLLIIPIIILPTLVFCFIFRKSLRYCYVTMRNSATLSLLNSDKVIDENTIYNYDVFVSYCNEDRNWVLDHLLPHVEKDCNVSVCLHERDFQVGLSILENIVSCMDRSRSIMLVISQQFLLSQWCQFEMHLAQHRLLETRREDLILVLLEEIPRRLRPTTLHYLMLTKTYIVWPKQESEEPVFWRRMKRSLLADKLRSRDNVSLA